LVLTNLASVLVDLERAAEARPLHEQALQGLPGDPRLLANYGICLAALGERDRARDVLDASLASDPNNEEALVARANLDVRPAVGEASGIVVAQGLGWLFAVAAGFGDDGTITVGEAEAAAYRLGANAALAVTDQRPADAVLAYCREAQAQGRAVAATMWTGRQHDGPLKRTVVSLFPPG